MPLDAEFHGEQLCRNKFFAKIGPNRVNFHFFVGTMIYYRLNVEKFRNSNFVGLTWFLDAVLHAQQLFYLGFISVIGEIFLKMHLLSRKLANKNAKISAIR